MSATGRVRCAWPSTISTTPAAAIDQRQPDPRRRQQRSGLIRGGRRLHRRPRYLPSPRRPGRGGPAQRYTAAYRPGHAVRSRAGRLTRRSLLRGAAGGAALLAGGGLPAWARPVPGSRPRVCAHPTACPFPICPPGTPSMPQIEHIVVLMMENHSFDNLLGMVPHQVPGRSTVDGLTLRRGRLRELQPRRRGRQVYAARASLSLSAPRPAHPGLERQPPGLRQRAQRRLRPGQRAGRDALLGRARPAVHLLAGRAVPDRRALLLLDAGPDLSQPPLLLHRHGVGHRSTTNGRPFSVPAANGTIFDRLDAHRINWGIYYQDLPSCADRPGVRSPPARAPRVNRWTAFYTDAAAGRLPAFTFLDPDYATTSEENPQDIQVGERFVAEVVHAPDARARPGSAPRCSSPTTSTAATTTTCRRRARSRPTRSRRRAARPTVPGRL